MASRPRLRRLASSRRRALRIPPRCAAQLLQCTRPGVGICRRRVRLLHRLIHVLLESGEIRDSSLDADTFPSESQRGHHNQNASGKASGRCAPYPTAEEIPKEGIVESDAHATKLQKIRIEQHSVTGCLWFAAWLFTIGLLHLSFWKGALAIILWPYYLGLHFSALLR
jgi:hypothetical protein